MSIIYCALYPGVKNGLYLHLQAKLARWAAHGISAIQLPPLCQTQYGGDSSTLGYDPIRDLDWGQWPSRPLRWGSAQQAQAFTTFAHKVGVKVVEDLVIHQYGGKAPLYEIGEDGEVDHDLFPKLATAFVPKVKVDEVFSSEGNQSYGQMVSYQNSLPKGYMLAGKIATTKLRHAALGLDGGLGRVDEAKGESVETARALMGAFGGGISFAEMYSGNPVMEGGYVAQTGMTVLDFTRHFAYRGLSQGAPLSSLVGNGYCFRDPSHAAIFVESNDTMGMDVVNNKLWCYLDALTIPARYVNLYAGDFEDYGLEDRILNMCWISEMFAIGRMRYEYVDDSYLVWSRDGAGGSVGWSGGLLCGISSDPLRSRSEWVHTPFGPNRHLHNYADTDAGDIWTNADGWVYLTIPPNSWGSGQSYVAYAPAGVNRSISPAAIPSRTLGSLYDFNGIPRLSEWK